VSTVGYSRPPVATRFKPGKSGNPKGRPKGSRNLAGALADVYVDRIVVREGVKTRRISRLEALQRKQMELALKGDQRAAQAVLKNARELGLLSQPPAPPQKPWDLTVLSDEELYLLEKLVRKMEGLPESEEM